MAGNDALAKADATSSKSLRETAYIRALERGHAEAESLQHTTEFAYLQVGENEQARAIPTAAREVRAGALSLERVADPPWSSQQLTLLAHAARSRDGRRSPE